MALTDQRLMILGPARLKWRPGNFLGFVGTRPHLQVTVPGTGSGWRTLVIHLANSQPCRSRSRRRRPADRRALSSVPATIRESREPG